MENIEIAEYTIKCLEKVSIDFGEIVFKFGGIESLVNYIDFFEF